jgi:hypothetical protein
MYEKGLLGVKNKDDFRAAWDSRLDGFVDDVPAGVVYLPHSCDEWIIGGKEQVKALIADLQAIVDDLPEWTPEKLPERKPSGFNSATVSDLAPMMAEAFKDISKESSGITKDLLRGFTK